MHQRMTTYERGVRVISMLRWPGVIKPEQVLSGIQAHQDMFTTFAAIAGVPDANEQIRRDKKQYIGSSATYTMGLVQHGSLGVRNSQLACKCTFQRCSPNALPRKAKPISIFLRTPRAPR